MLGYDAQTGAETAFPPDLPVEAAAWRVLTEEPRRYGFHATLKAPFHLADGTGEDELVAAVRDFARGRVGFALGPLLVAGLGSFVALVPAEPAPELDALAAACTRRLDRFRAPLAEADRARRLAAPLTERQIRHLDAWGYPYVLEDFRLHMTLTGALPTERRGPVRDYLARTAPPDLGAPVEDVAVYKQDDRSGRFRILVRCAFGG